MAQAEGGLQLSSVLNAFSVIERVSETDEIGVTALANDLDMHKSTAHTYLSTLEDAGYLVKDDGKYRISLEFMRLGVVARQTEVFEMARRKLSQLETDFSRSANIGIHEQGYLYVARVTELDKVDTEGKTPYLHATGLGKAILAQLPKDRVSEIIEERGLPELTEHTITDRAELFDELEAIRGQGYAVDAQECATGTRCLAAPITDSDGHPRAAISVSGRPEPIRQHEAQGDIIRDLIQTADEIESMLGYS